MSKPVNCIIKLASPSGVVVSVELNLYQYSGYKIFLRDIETVLKGLFKNITGYSIISIQYFEEEFTPF